MSSKNLIEVILALSNSKFWPEAKLEWKLERIYISIRDRCLCGQNPIKEVCIIKNTLNGNKAKVGNSCVMNFMNIDSDKVFYYGKSIMKNKNPSMTLEVVEYCYDNKILNEWEFDFCKSVLNLKLKSDKQQESFDKIITKINSKLKFQISNPS